MKNLLKKKDFAEAGALYFIATLFNKGIGFVTVPIFSRILTTSDYGTVTTFNSWVSMISVFISLALYNAVRNSFVDMDDKERPHFLSTIITFTGLVFIDNRIQKSFFIRFHLDTFLGTYLCTGRTSNTVFFILNFNHLISFPHNTDSEIKTNSKLSTYALV